MKPLDIILIIACVAIVFGVAIAAFIRKKKGKCSCGDCSCCDCCKTDKNANALNKTTARPQILRSGGCFI